MLSARSPCEEEEGEDDEEGEVSDSEPRWLLAEIPSPAEAALKSKYAPSSVQCARLPAPPTGATGARAVPVGRAGLIAVACVRTCARKGGRGAQRRARVQLLAVDAKQVQSLLLLPLRTAAS